MRIVLSVSPRVVAVLAVPSARGCCFLAAPLFILAILSTPCRASLAPPAQSASAAATAAAGAEAAGHDASTAFYNPAALTLLGRNELTVSAGFVFPRTRFQDGSATDSLGLPVGGSTAVSDSMQIAPSAFGLWVPSSALRVGLAVTEPFGQSVTYDNSWVGRYFVTRGKLEVVDVSPVVGWRVNDWLSLGGGPDYQYARVKREAAIDFGGLCQGVFGPPACTAAGLSPQAADGSSSLEATSNAWGYNLGTLVEFSPRVRLGFTYRSKLVHEFRGTASFSIPGNALPLTATGLFRQTGASANLTFPESAALAGFAQVTDRVALLASVRWTRWSRFTTLTTNFDNPAQSRIVEPLEWRDTIRWAGGLNYRFSGRVTLHGGVAYENSLVPDATRSPLFPINATVNLSFGLTYAVNPSFVLVGSYTYQHVRSAPVNLVDPHAGAIQGTIDRDYNAIGVQAVIRF